MKLCKDCKHASKRSFLDWIFKEYGYIKCQHPELIKTDIVTGKKEYRHCYERAFCMGVLADKCDKEGKLWEAKPKPKKKPVKMASIFMSGYGIDENYFHSGFGI